MTVAFNHFGKGLVERMPRCRHGYFHVVNNDYTEWQLYAIGGSAAPTINSQGNRFVANSQKEVHNGLMHNIVMYTFAYSGVCIGDEENGSE